MQPKNAFRMQQRYKQSVAAAVGILVPVHHYLAYKILVEMDVCSAMYLECNGIPDVI